MSGRVSAVTSFFTSDDTGALTPQDISVSVWSATQIGGYAVCGVLAREIEKATDAPGFIPARLTVDLFKPVRTEPLTVQSAVIRRGNRIIMTDATVMQAGEPRARGTAVYLPATEDPPGQVWHRTEPIPTPPFDDGTEAGPPMMISGDNHRFLHPQQCRAQDDLAALPDTRRRRAPQPLSERRPDR